MKIKLLAKDVIEKIAAGEVIERPASIIKELVENSLDAGSTRIEVNFEGGGINKLEVSDNGIGMTNEELEIAFKRHATSKLETIDDLDSILTLGFRGEALPSIAAVSRVTVTTKNNDSDEAYKYKVQGGQNGTIEPAARAKGTTITAEDIFFNVPARKKFLKSETTERKNIIAIVESLALSRPDVVFKLCSGKKTVFDFPASSLKERFLQVFGSKLSDKIIPLEFKNPYIKVSGYITKAEVSYTNRNKIYTFLNSRPIYSPVIMHAVSQGYQEFVPQGRYPACLINVSINPDLIDVNVHPAKREVRFVNQHGIHEIIAKVLKNKLSQSPAKLNINLPETKSVSAAGINRNMYKHDKSRSFYHVEDKKSDYISNVDLSKVTEFSFGGPKRDKEEKGDEPVGKIIPKFQWKKKYVIAEDDEGILVIDQHTAWERINYEKLKLQLKSESIASQGTLIPEIMELEHSSFEILSDKKELLKKFGIYIEEFGPNMFKITGVTSVAGKVKNDQEAKDIIENIITLFEATGSVPEKDELYDNIMKIIACRASIKAGDKMSEKEIESMIKMLSVCEVPHRCPHGRPILIRITESELDTKFLR